MKLATLLENDNESTRLAKDYIEYASYEELTGTSFDDREDAVVIWQDTDTIADTPEEDADQDAEPDKYIVVKKDVPIGILNQFMQVVKANS